ncbi:MAG: SPOR domain-containing protein [Bacteroidales bacterium]
MNKVVVFLIIASTFAMNSCKDGVSFFGKSKQTEAEIANLQKQNEALRQELEGIEQEHDQEITAIRSDYEQKLADLQKQIEAGTMAEYDAYYVVVGSFKNADYAREYAKKIQEMGYEGKIVPGPYNFNLVTSGTYQTLKSSLEPMRQARENIATEAWVYFKR